MSPSKALSHAPEPALQFALTLGKLANARGYYSEGQKYLAAALASGQPSPSKIRARALSMASILEAVLYENDKAPALLEQSLIMARQVDDKPSIAFVLLTLGETAYFREDFRQAHAYLAESLQISNEAGYLGGSMTALNRLGFNAQLEGDFARAEALYEESLTLAHRTGDTSNIAVLLPSMGCLAYQQGKLETARGLFEQSLALWRKLGQPLNIFVSLLYLGRVLLDQAEIIPAYTCFLECLDIQREFRGTGGVAALLESCAGLLAALHDYEQAAQLSGAAAALRTRIRIAIPGHERAFCEQVERLVHAQLDYHTFSAAFSAGAAMSMDRALEVLRHIALNLALS